MGKFYKTVIKEEDIPTSDKGIMIRDIVPLIASSEYELEVMTLFGVEDMISEVISIPGAKSLVKSILHIDSKFRKFDVNCNLENVTCGSINEDNSLRLSFKGIKEAEALEVLEIDYFEADTKYSSKSDFLDLFKIDKYASFCVGSGLTDLLFENLKKLQEEYGSKKSFKKKYRIIRDEEDQYFVRAITSPTKYYNYNIRFSLFVTLLILHKSIKESGHTFKVFYCEYDESSIRVYFEKNITKNIKGLGKVKFQLEMVNDEIKREAMRFSGVNIIDIPNVQGETITIKPSKNRSKILTVSHGRKPDTVYEDLKYFDKVDKVQADMFEAAEQISKVQNADELRFALYERILNIKNEYLKEDQDKITPILKNKIYSLHELLVVMNKVEKLTSNLDAKAYLRYVFYDILTASHK